MKFSFIQTKNVQDESIKNFQEKFRLQIADKEKTIEGLSVRVDELQRQLAKSSQQLVGEVQELDLEKKYRLYFLKMK
jgi:uncharacterized coiled-coil protein SlyX